MTSSSPWALFILPKETDTKWLNESLRKSEQSNYGAGWQFWVASKGGEPPKKTSNGTPPQATESVPNDFQSDFASNSMKDCAEWLRDLPEDVALNRDVFAVVTEYSVEDDTFTACLVSADDAGGLEVEYFPQSTDTAAMQFATNSAAYFYEKATGYQNVCRKNGTPDRSYLREGHY